jgi:hypothetical protein
MEPITLISTALTLATPYLTKTGEKFAEAVGEDIWKVIKKPFTKEKEEKLSPDLVQSENIEKLRERLLQRIESDKHFKSELEVAVTEGQKALNAYYQQNINNQGEVSKQINIQDNSGNIQM